MKTYEERKKETCEWCALNKDIIFDPLMKPMHRLAPSSSFARDYRPCTALSHEDYEAELRAEIEKMERREAPGISTGMAISAGVGAIGALAGGPLYALIGAAVGAMVMSIAVAIARHQVELQVETPTIRESKGESE